MNVKNILCTLIICSTSIAVTVAKQESSETKLKDLNLKKTSLETEIKTEDAKRNASIDDVAPEIMERQNIKQDSICLELRSQLLDVNIEIAEIKSQNLTNMVNTAINSRETTVDKK